MMGYLCLCPPAVCRPSALTYSCRPRSSDADNLRILLSNSYRACSQENDKYDFDASSRGPHRPASPGHGTDLRDLEKQPRFGFLPAMASLSAPSWPSLSAPSRWCTASPPQSQRGGVLDGGDSPHEPRLHWSTCASTRRTMSPASRLVGAVHEPVLANPVREPPRELGGGGSRTSSRTQFANRRFTAGSPDSVRSRFTVRGGCRGRSRFTDHGSRTRGGG